MIKGEDIEFRIKPYAIRVKEPIIIDGIENRCSLNFTALKFDSIEIRNCKFEGAINLNGLKGKNFSFHNCSVKAFKLLGSTIDSLSIHSNNVIEEMYLDKSSINDLLIAKINHVNKLYLGCLNNVMRATFSHIGNKNTNLSQSSIYICPEQFGVIDIQQMCAGRVEIGTFGEHSVLKADGIFTDDFKIKNCDNSNSQVVLKNIKPLSEWASHVTIEDSVLDGTVMEASELKKFAEMSVENSEVGTLTEAVHELKKMGKARFWKRNISNIFSFTI